MTADELERPKIYAEYTGPGPLAYNLKPLTGGKGHDPTWKQAPSYSIGLPRINQVNDNPGPSDYNVADTVTAKGKQDLPTITLKGRLNERSIKDVTPAPGTYNRIQMDKLSTSKTAPAPKIGARFELPDYRYAPAPTTYSLPTTIGNGAVGRNWQKPPRWSIGSKRNFGSPQYAEVKKAVPAPTSYTCPPATVYKRQTGVYSMQGRTRRPDFNTAKESPAPGVYEVASGFGRSGKGPTMGVRHSQHTLLCFTQADMF